MALSAPRTIYGIHSVTLFNRSNRLPFGMMKVLGSLSFDFSGDFNDLYGGSSKYAWDSESGVLNSTITLNVKQFEDFQYEKFLGASATANAAETSGNCGTLTNQYGTSVVAATGVVGLTVESGEEDELKDGLIVVKAVGAATVDCYYMSDVDMNTGTDKVFETDLLKITASPLTVTTGGTVSVPKFGVELTGGAGTIGMTIGDTAYCFIRKINDGSSIITIGSSSAEFSAFGLHVASQKKGSNDVHDLTAWNCKGIGMPQSFTEAEWMTADITMRALYDSAENAVALIRNIEGP